MSSVGDDLNGWHNQLLLPAAFSKMPTNLPGGYNAD
jgi:hypothetical protein